MQVEVVDSEQQIFSGEIEYLVASAAHGELGIFPNHMPIIAKLKPGVLRMQLPDTPSQLILAISGGFIEVNRNHVNILADIIERTDDLDEEQLLAERDAALSRLKDSTNIETADTALTRAMLDITISKLRAVEYMKKRVL